MRDFSVKQSFDFIHLMTRGKPGRQSEHLAHTQPCECVPRTPKQNKNILATITFSYSELFLMF